MMNNLFFEPGAADQALVWARLDSHTYALCHMVQAPRLDGFGKQRLEPVSLYEYDPFAGQWLPCALTDCNSIHA